MKSRTIFTQAAICCLAGLLHANPTDDNSNSLLHVEDARVRSLPGQSRSQVTIRFDVPVDLAGAGMKSNYALKQLPTTATCLEDLDMDGDLDLVRGEPGSDPAQIRVVAYKNVGSRSAPLYSPIPSLLSGDSVSGFQSHFPAPMFQISFGDVNTDGKRDILISNNYFESVRSSLRSSDNYEWPGAASYGSPTLLQTKHPSGAGLVPIRRYTSPNPGGMLPRATVADWDGDGISDLLVTNPYYLLFYRGSNQFEGFYRTFERPEIMKSNGSTPLPLVNCITVGDVNGDGFVDLVATDLSGRLCWVERKSGVDAGGGAMLGVPDLLRNAEEEEIFVGGHTTIQVIDYTHDGKPDVFCGGVLEGIADHGIALSGDRTGLNFSEDTRPLVAYGYPRYLDVDSDGKVDILLAWQQGVDVCYNLDTGNGHHPKFAEPTPLDAGAETLSDTVDFDADGKMDPGVDGYVFMSGAVLVFRKFNGFSSDGMGSFQSFVLSPSIPANVAFASRPVVGDFDGNQTQDVVVRAYGSSGQFQGLLVYRNSITGGFSLTGSTMHVGAVPDRGLSMVDLDKDGDSDFISAMYPMFPPSGNTVNYNAIFHRNIAGTFGTIWHLCEKTEQQQEKELVFNGGSSSLVEVDVVDFNQDGKPDLGTMVNGGHAISYGVEGYRSSYEDLLDSPTPEELTFRGPSYTTQLFTTPEALTVSATLPISVSLDPSRTEITIVFEGYVAPGTKIAINDLSVLGLRCSFAALTLQDYSQDLDEDGLYDGWEYDYFGDLDEDGSGDADGDGLSNFGEQTSGADPLVPDTDADGLPDKWEVDHGLSPHGIIGIDGGSGDPDGDGLTNLEELTEGANPRSPDTDSDGMPDKWEVDHGLLPHSIIGVNGGNGDLDDDGFSNLQEYHQGTEPNNVNSRPKGMIVAKNFHTIALASDGRVWGWGYNFNGELGDGSTETRSSPVPLPGVAEMAKVLAIDTGKDYSVALDHEGNLWGWGSNAEHTISRDPTPAYSSPVRIELPAPVSRFACGRDHIVAVDRDGKLWSWGNNSKGQLGLGHSNVVTGPAEISKPSGMGAIESLEASEYTSYVTDMAGKVWSWGKNNYGQLGDGSNTDRKIPVGADVSNGVPAIRSISAGVEHTIATGVDGSIWTWGYNGYGQLGRGNIINQNKPIQVTSYLASAAKIGAGAYHNLAVSQTGYVWGWGANDERQLGLTSVVNSKVPIETGGVSGWSDLFQVAGGLGHSLALKGDGSVWAWGDNSYGQLGLGDYDDCSAAAPLPKIKLSDDDSDSDGLPDSWEYYYFNGSLSQTGVDVHAEGGVSNLAAYTNNLNPTLADNDNDGIPDTMELSAGLDPLDWSDATGDLDGDRIPNAWEISLGSSMSSPGSKPSVDASVNSGQSIQSAINDIPGNFSNPTWGIIQVGPGIYSENLSIPSDKRILLLSSGAGSVPEIRGTADYATVDVSGDSVIDGFRITHIKGVVGDGVSYNHSGPRQLSRIANCMIHGHSGTSQSVIAHNNGRLVIAHCTLYKNNTYGNGRSLYVNYDSRVLILNAIFWNPENHVSKEVCAYGMTEARRSIIRDASVAGALTDDPLLNAGGFLTGSSAARKKASSRAWASVDIQNEPRGGEPDIGSDQFVDVDNDNLPDLWEIQHWGNVSTQNGNGDGDGDGIINAAEHLIEKSPLAYNGVQNIEILDRLIDAASGSRNMRIRFNSYQNQQVKFNFHKFYYDFNASGGFGQSHFEFIGTECVEAVVGENIYTWDGIATPPSTFHSADVVAVEVVTQQPSPGSAFEVLGAPSDYVDSQEENTGVSAAWTNGPGSGSSQYHNVPTPVSYTIEGGEPLILNTKSHHTLLQNRPVPPQGIEFPDWLPITDSGSTFGSTGSGEPGGIYEPTDVVARNLPILSAIYENQYPEVTGFTVQSYRTIPSNGQVGHICFHLSKATQMTLNLALPDLSRSPIYVRQTDGSYIEALNLPLAAGSHDLEFRVLNYETTPAQPTHFSHQHVVQGNQAGFFRVRAGWVKDNRRQGAFSQEHRGFKWAHIHVE